VNSRTLHPYLVPLPFQAKTEDSMKMPDTSVLQILLPENIQLVSLHGISVYLQTFSISSKDIPFVSGILFKIITSIVE
jgi:hypothetical protein